MAKKPQRTAIDLDGFEEITVTRTRHSEPTLYVNTADSKYPIARLSMGAVQLLRAQVGEGDEIRVRVLHNAQRRVGVLVIDDANGYTISENGGLSGGAFADERMLGTGIKAKYPVSVLNPGAADGAPRGLTFSTVAPLPSEDEATS